ncbi:MAG: hypothetical protein WAT58_02475, partial [Candidatus Dormiibacterota bacterium]
PYLVAGSVAAVLAAGAVAGGFAMNAAAHRQEVSAATITATATPASEVIATPSDGPSASPAPGPSPSPASSPASSPARRPAGSSGAPPPGRVSVANTTIFYRTCSAPGSCFAETDGSANNTPANPVSIPCHSHIVVARAMAVREQYDWTYSGQGAAVTLHLAWSGRLPNGSADPGTSWDSDSAKPGKSGTHAWSSGSNEYLDGSTNLQTGLGYLEYRLTWTNPDGSPGSSPAPTRIYYQCS